MFKVRGTLKASSRNRVHFAASPGLRWLIRSLALWAWDVHLTGPSLNFVISKIEVSVCSIWWQACFLRTYACTHVHTHAHTCTRTRLDSLPPAWSRDPSGVTSGAGAPPEAPRGCLSLQDQLLGTASSHSSGTTSLALRGLFHGWLFVSYDLPWA